MEWPHQCGTSTGPEKLNGEKMNTTVLLNSFIQTLDLDQFIRETEQLDSVTRRQCLLRALKELSRSRTIRLHGQRLVRKALRGLHAHHAQIDAGRTGKMAIQR